VIHFYAFDIRTNHGYINYDKCIEIFEKLDIFHAKILQRGTLEEVVKFEVEGFQTTIPKLLGLPDIEGNIAEGVIIKPVNTHYISGDRVIVKKKTKAFSEVNVESIMKLKKEKKKNVEINKHSDEVIELSDILVCYVTINRIKNLISKIGEVKVDEVNSLIGLLAKDAFIDFKADYESRYEKLKEEEKKSLSKKLANASKDLISTNASKIVKNEL
jgi:Rnl2 family RNA ligase